jgi:hypothetical protein
LPDEKFLVSQKKMRKLLNKGAVGAVVYVQKLQLQQPESVQSPALQQLLDQYRDVFAKPTTLPPRKRH